MLNDPAPETGGPDVRTTLDWPGAFSVQDPEPANHHSPLYLVFPNGLMVNISSDARPGMDLARGEWMAGALNAALDARADDTQDDDRFWLALHEPHCVPERKGPWPRREMRKILREFMQAWPTSYIDVLTIDYDGPDIQHGPEALQMLDGRSMITGRKHNARTRVAHAAAHAALAPPPRAEDGAGAAPEGAAGEPVAAYNSRFDAADEAGQEIFDAGFWHGWMWVKYPDWTDNEEVAREEYRRSVDGVALGEAWDAHRDAFFKRLPLEALSRGPAIPAGIEAAGLGAQLPEGFHWGAEALEQFEFGKRRAVEAILAALTIQKPSR